MASLHDFGHAEAVAEGLAGPGDVAVDLFFDVMLAERGVVAEVLLCLLACPAHSMHAGVDDETRGAPGLEAQHAELLVGGVVHVHLGAETLAVERPAFAEGGAAATEAI